MLGPIGRATGAQLRRNRRRILLLGGLALLVALIVGEITDMVVDSYGASNRVADQSWVSTVTPILVGSSSLAPYVHDLRTNGPGLTRTKLDTDVGILVGSSTAAKNELDDVRLPPPRAAGTLATTVIDQRAAGAAALEQAVSLATGPDRDTANAATRLGLAGKDFHEADVDYAKLRAALGTKLGRQLERGGWIAVPASWQGAAAANFVRALSNAPSLAEPKKLVFLAISLFPGPTPPPRLTPITTTTTTTTSTTTTIASATGATGALSTTSSVPTSSSTTSSVPPTTLALPAGFVQVPPAGVVSRLLATTKLTVILVVENASGSALPLTLTATLTATNGSVPSRTATTKTASVAAGGSVYLTMPKLAVSNKASSYTLTVTAAGTGLSTATRTLALTIPPAS